MVNLAVLCSPPRQPSRAVAPSGHSARFRRGSRQEYLVHLQELIGYPQAADDPYLAKAKHISFLLIVHRGLGLRFMALIAPAAYWAAWADILPTIAA